MLLARDPNLLPIDKIKSDKKKTRKFILFIYLSAVFSHVISNLLNHITKRRSPSHHLSLIFFNGFLCVSSVERKSSFCVTYELLSLDDWSALCGGGGGGGSSLVMGTKLINSPFYLFVNSSVHVGSMDQQFRG